MTTFRIARMCTTIRALTIFLWLLPVVFLIAARSAYAVLFAPAILIVVLYAWVWLRFRPTRFVVHPEAIEIIWPLKRRSIPRASIAGVKIITARELKAEVGWCARVGAGGLWGGFGWLWTQRRGIVQMCISRVDRFVWIERKGERSWLITPENPEAFVEAMAEGRNA